MSNQGGIDVSGNGGGTIRLRGGVLVAENSARLAANSTGERDHTGIIDVQAPTMRLDNSVVQADAHSSGRGGTIMIAAGDLQVLNGGLIRANTSGAGAAGTVSVRADRLFISRDGATDTGIVSRTERLATGAGGRIGVTAGDLQVRNGGVISATTFGAGDAGTVSVTADRLLISRDGAPTSSELVSNANAGGAGGRVEVIAGDLQVLNGGRIRANTAGAGDAGTVSVTADRLLISGDGARDPTTGRPADTGIFSITGGGTTGAGGRIEVTAGDLQMLNGGQISVNTSGFGDGGTVSVTADRLFISRDGAPVDTGIVSRTVRNLPGSGAGGQIEVTAGDLQVLNGGQIRANTSGAGDAGAVIVRADRLLIISGDGARDPTTGRPAITGIASSTRRGATGAGGQVDIQAPTMLLREGGTVTTESEGSGSGGAISITAADILQLDNAEIRTRTASANGGNVTLKAGRLFDLHNSTVTTSVAGGTGNGGNIFIDPPLMVLNNSQIIANAQKGHGGDITIRTGQLIRSSDSVIRAASEESVSGTITITAPNTDVAGSLVVLPETLLDASSQLRVACAARGGRPGSSFARGGRGGLPPDPGTPLMATPSGQPLEQQTATGSPTTSTAKPSQAAKPVMMAGTSQPVLGSPRLTCRG
jgi:large exoprotein involved in heme utilization and adhesion